jgi:hypothetical protein
MGEECVTLERKVEEAREEPVGDEQLLSIAR